MGFNKYNLDVFLSRFFVKAGVVLSALAISMFFLDMVKFSVFAGIDQAAVQCDTNSSQCDIEDETEEDGQNFPTLVTFSKNYILVPAFDLPHDVSNITVNSIQSPPDFPPEAI